MILKLFFNQKKWPRIPWEILEIFQSKKTDGFVFWVISSFLRHPYRPDIINMYYYQDPYKPTWKVKILVHKLGHYQAMLSALNQ